MEEKETPTQKVITSEEVQSVIDSVDKAVAKVEELNPNDPATINYEKIKEVIKAFEGETEHTVLSSITTSMLLLPAGAILQVIKMAKQAFTAKAMVELMALIGQENHEEETKETEE